MSSTLFIDQPCERCGSKKRLTASKKEKIETYSGTSIVETTQIVCTNAKCQKLFEENRAKEVIRIADINRKKAEQDEIRKENAIKNIALKRKNKLAA